MSAATATVPSPLLRLGDLDVGALDGILEPTEQALPYGLLAARRTP